MPVELSYSHRISRGFDQLPVEMTLAPITQKLRGKLEFLGACIDHGARTVTTTVIPPVHVQDAEFTAGFEALANTFGVHPKLVSLYGDVIDLLGALAIKQRT